MYPTIDYAIYLNDYVIGAKKLNPSTVSINYRYSKFPAGEVFLKIDPECLPLNDKNIDIEIVINPISSDDVMKILLANDAIRRLGYENIYLYMPYVPYGRQDRVMSVGEPLSLKVFSDIINGCNFKMVKVLDPHSSVTDALFNNLVTEDISWWIQENINTIKTINPNSPVGLVSPDTGAIKRSDSMAKLTGIRVSSIASKERQPNGDIKFSVNFAGHPPEVVIIGDDICDGGKTFIELAKVLKENHGVKKVYLIVTHGIFSNGFKVFDGLLDGINAYNKWPTINDEKN